ncbi:MAG TPA: AzlD domain-containing protein [Gammaproteobacteria bacterium]|jgi:branched-subunit amino acid transport protein|nr:AzlD domain-containing protein [Gammaproteobacteria bacterium]
MTEVLLIVGMALVTFLPRYLPLALAGRYRLPPLLRQCLGYVPIAVLSAIITQTVFVSGGDLRVSLGNPYLWGALAAAIVALLNKPLFWSISAGLAAYVAAFILM